MGLETSKNEVLSTVAASGSAVGLYYGAKKALSAPMKKYKNQLIFSAVSNNEAFREPAMKALTSEKIKFKHVDHIFDFVFDDDVLNMMAKEDNSVKGKISKVTKKVSRKITPKKIEEMLAAKKIKKMDAFMKGENACALNDKVFVNFNKISAASFHEMGHAKNYKDFGGKILQKMRGPLISKGLLGIAFASALLLSDKDEKERTEIEKNGDIVDKSKLFLKDNCVGLAALSQAPVLAEEGLASIKGATIGKKYLSPQNLAKLNLFNLGAWGTYLLGAAVIVGTVFAADKTKNALT